MIHISKSEAKRKKVNLMEHFWKTFAQAMDNRMEDNVRQLI